MIGARDGIDTIVESDSAIKPLKLQSLEEFVQRPSVSFHVRGIVPTQGIVIAFGPPKGGKTFSIGDLTLHAAHGLPEWHGYKIPRRVRVAYLAGEGTLGLKVRFKAWLDHHDNLDKSGDFLVLPEALSLPDNCNEVLELLKPFNPGIVVLDTLNAYFGAGNEDATPDMSAFCCAVRALRDGLKCAIIVIHHTGHGNQGRERGSIVLRASADVLIQVAKDEGGSGNVGFQVLTGRDIEAMETPIALRLRRVESEWTDDEGTKLTTCIVEAADTPVTLPGRDIKPLTDGQNTVLAVIRELAAQKGGGKYPVLLARADIAPQAILRGVPKASAYRNIKTVAERMGWKQLEPGAVEVSK